MNIHYDTTQTNLSGFGGKLKVGKGSKGFWRYPTGATWLSPGLELNDLGYLRSADVINQENIVSYLINQPVSVFHTYEISLEQFNTWNFNGTHLESGRHLSFSSEFKNNWSFSTNLILHTEKVDTRILRGGPDMIVPNSMATFGKVKTDPSQKIIAEFSSRQKAVNNYILQDYTDITSLIYSIANPDFNFHEFRSNLVAEWEYLLGSFIYFVWSSERSGRTSSSQASFSNFYKELQKVFPINIFPI